MQIIMALISGVVFGVGLTIAGMLDPSKISGFLDIFGVWDPSLAVSYTHLTLPTICSV